MALDLTEFREVFFDEVAEHLAIVERCLREIDLGNAGSEVVAEAYRCAHSIKGGSATFGFEEMLEQAKSLAGLLDLARLGRLVLDAAALDTCRQAQATLVAQLAARRCGTKAPDASPLPPVVSTAAMLMRADEDAQAELDEAPSVGEEDAASRIDAAVDKLRDTAAHMQRMMARLEQLSREHAELADRAATAALQFERQMRDLLDDPALVERSAEFATRSGAAGSAPIARIRRGEGAPLPKVRGAGTKRRSLEQEWEEI